MPQKKNGHTWETDIAVISVLCCDTNDVTVRPRNSSPNNHVSMVVRLCNYHTQAIHHIRHLLSTELAQMLACSQILSRVDYCNAVLNDAPTGTIQKLQRVQNNAARIVLQVLRRYHAKLFTAPTALVASPSADHIQVGSFNYKVRSTSTSVYLQDRITEPVCSRTLRPPVIPLLIQPFTRTDVFLIFSTVCLQLAATNSFD